MENANQLSGLNDNRLEPITDLSNELPEVISERAAHASEIVAKLNHRDGTLEGNYTNKTPNSQPITKLQIPMEISEKAIDVINWLIEINNDRIEGFEQASHDLEKPDNGLITVFNKLADDSRQNVGELTEVVHQFGGEASRGTSTSGALHRVWLDVKSVFTGGDQEAILDECERGEDAIKAAYDSALDPENEFDTGLVRMLQLQQLGIDSGHAIIKSLRNQVRVNDDEDEDVATEDNDADFQVESVATEPYFENVTNEFDGQRAYAVEPDSEENEEAFEAEQATSRESSKLMSFFVDELKDLLWAERELAETLPDMADAATSQELKTAFTNHLAETEVHVTRLEQIFGILGLKPDTTKCDAMAGIVDEGDEIIGNTENGTAQRDVGLIFAGQKAEHYEIASYGGMISLAKTLGYYDIAEILVMTIEEEKNADAILTDIAENHVNYEASTERTDD